MWLNDIKERHDSKVSLQQCHNGRDGVSNLQPHDCLLNRLFKRRSKKISKLRVTGLCAGIYLSQMASNAENVSIWCPHSSFFESIGVHENVTNEENGYPAQRVLTKMYSP